MSRNISIFTNYHQKENSLTNYCGLLMKLLYEDSPKAFEELLTTLLKKDIVIGPTFTQQVRKTDSIPDLVITQKSFSIIFETKITDWYYEDQIVRHLKGFDLTSENNILFLLSNFEYDDLEKRFEKEMKIATEHGVMLKPLTFEDFIGSLETVCKSDFLKRLLDEFKVYLDENELLPRWKYLLDVVSCSETLNEVNEIGVYMCPDTGGAYSHRRAKYFGAYASKEVAQIFEIRAIVVVGKDLGDTSIKWKNTQETNEALIEEARTKLQWQKWRIEENQSVPIQVFLLGNGQPTRFIKESSGGMLQSKKYFWDIAIDCKNSKELASKLSNEHWGKYL